MQILSRLQVWGCRRKEEEVKKKIFSFLGIKIEEKQRKSSSWFLSISSSSRWRISATAPFQYDSGVKNLHSNCWRSNEWQRFLQDSRSRMSPHFLWLPATLLNPISRSTSKVLSTERFVVARLVKRETSVRNARHTGLPATSLDHSTPPWWTESW